MFLSAKARRAEPDAQPWILTPAGVPYFADADGGAWTPIGQNDAVTWPDLAGLYRRRDPAAVEAYLADCAAHGVTCLRLMMEYSQTRHRYFERRAGEFNKDMVRLWDDLFALLRLYNLRVLLTPFDTFWMWNHWKHHPYNLSNGGPCDSRNRWMLCSDTRRLIRGRLEFATERWGGDGTIFAWDLWNEIHPCHAGNSAEPIADFIEDLSTHLRSTEQRLHGAAHLQTVSVFTPAFELDRRLEDIVFRHKCLDFVNVHLYEEGTIDDPKNTVDAAVSVGRLIAQAVAESGPERPVFDSEHGPIHTFKDHHKSLSAEFDDEYFRHIQWAHLASGGAGGGMRWPNRSPHSLTPGMRDAQKVLSDFLPQIAWTRFRRVNRSSQIRVSRGGIEVFACGDESQAVVYLLRRDTLQKSGLQDPAAAPITTDVFIPGLRRGALTVTFRDPITGASLGTAELAQFSADDLLITTPPFRNELVLAIRHHRV